MNEMYVISVLMLYTLIVLIDTVLNTYRLLATNEIAEEKEFIYPKQTFVNHVQSYIAPMILRINFKKDHVLNKKRRPPIILVAHLG